VRIDVITSRFSTRTRAWLDIFGFVLFLFPFTLLLLYYSVPYAMLAIETGEMSSNAGGLIQWPAKILIPIGFLMLTLQGLSELIKRIGYLQGKVDASEFETHVVAIDMAQAAQKTE
jgi:TRAP-type mannitol/chloroaromatic compound transport system permease small subunit